jgi:hypothetical protein
VDFWTILFIAFLIVGLAMKQWMKFFTNADPETKKAGASFITRLFK